MITAVTDRIDRLPPHLRQIARFLVTGGMNTVFSYIIYVLLAGGLGLGALQALGMSWCVGVVFSYLTFRAFVFTDGNRSFKTFAKFLPIYAVLLVVNMAGLYMLADVAGWNKLVAQALIVPFCAGLSFTANRLFVFRAKKGIS